MAHHGMAQKPSPSACGALRMSSEPLIALLNIEPAEYDEDWRPTYWPIRRPSELRFEVPDWVPAPVSRMALALYGDLAEWAEDDLELVKRLATDERLKFVWHELKRKTRSQHDPTYLHPGNPSAQALNWIGRPSGANTRQAAAMAELFRAMVLYAMEDLPALMRQPQPHQDAKTGMKLAGQLRTFAARLSGRRASSNKKRILDAAAACEELASKPCRCPKCGMKHPVWDDEPDTRHAREVTIWAASECRELFGTTGYNTVASIVSVILGRKMKKSSVREWLPQTVR
jgi:hypothetical protein